MKRIIIMVIVMSCVLILSCMLSSYTSIDCSINFNKISNELLKELSLNESDAFSVAIWFNEPSSTIKLSNSFKSTINELQQSNVDGKEISDLKQSYLNQVKNEYKLYNNNMSKKIEENKLVYVCQYSPVVVAELSTIEIYELSFDDDVEMLCLYVEDDNEIEEDLEQYETDSSSRFNSLNRFDYDGTGIKIGIRDGGIPSTGFLTTYNIPSSNCYGEYIGTHVECVTETCMLYAPNADYYFAGGGSLPLTKYEVTEWLVDQNVDLISMTVSYGSYNTYTDYARWVDHIGYMHSILVLMAAGNYGSSGVVSPGMAYNIITVGNVGINYDEYFVRESSSYSNSTSTVLPFKPDICAYGEYNGSGGTSISTPRVCGIAARVMQANSILKAAPAVLKSILMSSVDYQSSLNFLPSNRIENTTSYMQVGSGVVFYDGAIYTASLSYPNAGGYYSSTMTPNSYYEDFTFTLNSNNCYNDICVVFTYLSPVTVTGVHSSNNGSIVSVPNFEMYVYNPNNICVGSSLTTNNVEKVQFQANQMGTYTIRVLYNGTITDSYPCGVSWFTYY